MGGRDIMLPTDGYCWDSVVLNASLERFVRQDFGSFFRREEWFRRHNLPYRRGYLLYGPPGNTGAAGSRRPTWKARYTQTGTYRGTSAL